MASPPAKRIRRSKDEAITRSAETVTIRVVNKSGKKRQTHNISIHQNLLTGSSVFFANINKGGWSESSGLVEFTEFSVETVTLFADFLYSGHIYSENSDDVVKMTDAGVKERPELGRLKKLWLFADYIQCSDLKDALMDAYIETLQGAYHITLAEVIYGASQKDSAHRKFAVDFVLYHAREHNDHAKKLLLEAEGDLGEDLRTAMVDFVTGEGGSKKFSYDTNPCQYHEHTVLEKTCYTERYGPR